MIAGTARIFGEGPKLLNRAEADPVRFSEGSVDSPRFGDAHLRPMDKGRNIVGIRITIPNEPFRVRGLVNYGFEHPTISRGIAEPLLQARFDPIASAAGSQMN